MNTHVNTTTMDYLTEQNNGLCNNCHKQWSDHNHNHENDEHDDLVICCDCYKLLKHYSTCPDGHDSYKCPECSEHSDETIYYENKVICKDCFNSKQTLKELHDEQEEGEEPYGCETCGCSKYGVTTTCLGSFNYPLCDYHYKTEEHDSNIKEECECGSTENLKKICVGGSYEGNAYETWCQKCIDEAEEELKQEE